MWRILIKTGLAPPGTTGPEADDDMPANWGVGFCDVGTGHPGTVSSQFKSDVFIQVGCVEQCMQSRVCLLLVCFGLCYASF